MTRQTEHASGFAAAVQPITTSTRIETDARGIDSGWVEIPLPGPHALRIKGYRAHPAGQANRPAILVVQEVFGVHEHIQDVVRRLAKLGYYAIAPELFHREGDVSGLPIEAIRPLVSRIADSDVLSDLDATLAFAEKEKADVSRAGLTGFCWGGRIAWLYAAHQPLLKAAVAWYGRLQGEATANQPRFPVDVAAALKAPVLGLYGGADAGIPVETVNALQSKLEAAGSESRIRVYPEAPHAFFADYRPSYRAEAAQDAWLRLQDWFRIHLGSPA
jgi:carboxymethylenebutenolidase